MAKNLTTLYTQTNHFLNSRYFHDGLKISVCGILPALIAGYFGQLALGISMSLGAILMSVVDGPGPILHRRNSMLITLLLTFIVTLIVNLSGGKDFLLGLELVVFTFFFSILPIYGNRAASIGVSCLIAFILHIDYHFTPQQSLFQALFTAIGGLWYLIMSLSLDKSLPHRAAEQNLGRMILEFSKFVELKSHYYGNRFSISRIDKQMIDQEIKIHNEDLALRELLFQTRKKLRDSSVPGNRLLITYIHITDLFEKITESHFDYAEIRATYNGEFILKQTEHLLLILASDLNKLGNNIHNHVETRNKKTYLKHLEILKSEIDRLADLNYPTHKLKRILVNLRYICNEVESLYNLQSTNPVIENSQRKEFNRYITHQSIDFKVLRNNLNFGSNAFRHALRVTIICFAAFLFTKYIFVGQHSYWILMTIVIILKPAYAQTKKSNWQRLLGTILGGLFGLFLLSFIEDTTYKIILTFLFMILSYSFSKINYYVSVFFMTPLVVLLFQFVDDYNNVNLIRERVMDTVVAGIFCVLASHFLFPLWEENQLKKYLLDRIQKNAEYLKYVLFYREENLASITTHNLARTKQYVSNSNLSSALQRMLNEPKSKQKIVNELIQYILLNNLFSANTASIAQKLKNGYQLSLLEKKEVNRVLNGMNECLKLLKEEQIDLSIKEVPAVESEENLVLDNINQLNFIVQDLKKSSTKLELLLGN